MTLCIFALCFTGVVYGSVLAARKVVSFAHANNKSSSQARVSQNGNIITARTCECSLDIDGVRCGDPHFWNLCLLPFSDLCYCMRVFLRLLVPACGSPPSQGSEQHEGPSKTQTIGSCVANEGMPRRSTICHLPLSATIPNTWHLGLQENVVAYSSWPSPSP